MFCLLSMWCDKRFRSTVATKKLWAIQTRAMLTGERRQRVLLVVDVVRGVQQLVRPLDFMEPPVHPVHSKLYHCLESRGLQFVNNKVKGQFKARVARSESELDWRQFKVPVPGPEYAGSNHYLRAVGNHHWGNMLPLNLIQSNGYDMS
jgi:hypothetical protein